jgi:hypothetical protein
LFFASRVAERDYMRHNINLLFFNPLLLAAIPLGIYAAQGKTIAALKKFAISAERCLCILWLCIFTAGLITLLLEFIPGLYQENQSTLLMLLPITFVAGPLVLERRKPFSW